MYCKNCGIELEDAMLTCPLCGEAVGDNTPAKPTPGYGKQVFAGYTKMSKPQKKLTWEIVSLILLSAAIATFVVDFILNRRITWSEYPVAICLAIFCYISLFAFWDRSVIIEMGGGLLLSSFCLLILDLLTNGIQWSVKLGMPLLLAANLVIAALITMIRKSKYKGINLVAYIFLGAILLCIFTEGAISFFKTGLFRVQWSVIVAACAIPVIIVLLFVHFRLKKGRSLKKTFHV